MPVARLRHLVGSQAAEAKLNRLVHWLPLILLAGVVTWCWLTGIPGE